MRMALAQKNDSIFVRCSARVALACPSICRTCWIFCLSPRSTTSRTGDPALKTPMTNIYQKILKKGPMNTTLKETNMGFKTNPKVQSLPKTVEPHQVASSDVAKGRWDSLDPAPLSLSLPARRIMAYHGVSIDIQVNLPLSLGKCRCCADLLTWAECRFVLLRIVLCLSYPGLDPFWYLTSHSTANTSQN